MKEIYLKEATIETAVDSQQNKKKNKRKTDVSDASEEKSSKSKRNKINYEAIIRHFIKIDGDESSQTVDKEEVVHKKNKRNRHRGDETVDDEALPQVDLIMNVSYEAPDCTAAFARNTRRCNGRRRNSYRTYVRHYNKNLERNEPFAEQTFVGTPPIDAPSMRTEEGTILRLNEAQFGPSLPSLRTRDQSDTCARKSYKHLIKGDIVVMFKNANLHQIKGYAVRKK